jgi:hypothetical protein
VVEAALSQPPRETNLQWLVVAAAMLLGILVVAGLVSSRLNRASVPSHQAPTPVADYGTPPTGVPLIYVLDSNHQKWLIGFDWSGKPRGTIKLAYPSTPQGPLQQSPDGSAFVYASNPKMREMQFLDRLGQPVPGDSSLTYQFQMWADDSKHLCTLNADGRQWNLGLRLAGAAPARTSVVAIDPSIAQSGIIAISLAACSARNDRAVLAYAYMGRPTMYWVVRISDGHILSQRTEAAYSVGNVVASGDGSLVAENSAKSNGQLIGATAPHTTIRRAADGSVAINLDPTYGVLAFNKDNSVALVYTSPWASGVATHVALINVGNGAILWRSDGTTEFSGVFVQPDGNSLAVLLQDPSDQTLNPSVNVFILRPDGSATAVQGSFVRP